MTSKFEEIETQLLKNHITAREATLRLCKLLKEFPLEQIPGYPIHSGKFQFELGSDPVCHGFRAIDELPPPKRPGVGVHSNPRYSGSVWDRLAEPRRHLLGFIANWQGTRYPLNRSEINVLREVVNDLRHMVPAAWGPGSRDDGGGPAQQEGADDASGLPPDASPVASTTYTGLQAQLNPWEMQVLLETAGWLPPSKWGAAIGATLEYLEGLNLIKGTGLTPAGWAYIIRKAAQEGAQNDKPTISFDTRVAGGVRPPADDGDEPAPRKGG